MLIPTVNNVRFENTSREAVEESLKYPSLVLDKVKKAIAILDAGGYDNFYIGHSGGKDSCAVTYLMDTAGYKLLPVLHTVKLPGTHNGVHPMTLEFLYELSGDRPVTFVPEFAQKDYIDREGYAGQIDGTRKDENERGDRSSDLVFNGETINRKDMQMYNPSGLFGIPFIYPIQDWTTAEVWAMLITLGIPVSEEYAKWTA